MAELSSWLDRAARGDEEAYRNVYRQCRPLVVRLARGFAHLDESEVEDVVQESFVRAFKALPRLRERSSFVAWLLAIARNCARTLARRKARDVEERERFALEAEASTSSLPAVQLERDCEIARQLIAELPPGPEKETVELFYVKGELSAREIAERLGVGKSAVTMRLERFRARIKRELLRRVLLARVD